MQVIRRSFTYLRKYFWLALGAFVFMLIVTACGLLIPSYIQTIIDDGVTASNLDVIKSTTLTLIAIAVVEAISSFFRSYLAAKSSQGIAYDIRNQLYEKLEHLEFSFHDKYPIGQLLTRTTSDVEAVRNFYANGLLQLFSAIIMLVGALSILFSTSARLTGVILLLVPVILFLFFRLFRAMSPIFGRVQKKLGELNTVLQENIEGVRVVKSFTAEDIEADRYDGKNEELLNINLKVIKLFANNFPFVFLITNLMTLISLYLGGRYVVAETLTIGELISYNAYLTFLIQPIFQLGMISQQLSRATASSKRIFEVLDKPIEIESPPDAKMASPSQPFDIRMRGVSFRYTEDSEDVVKDINLHIAPGQTVGILGNTGSGKSSLINLIPRFYDATAGTIEIDGIDVREYDLSSLRRQIGVVLQDIKLLHRSIRDNVRFGRPHATDEEIMEVCEIAQIADFIRSTPEGLDYVIGEGGGNISGGQRQRIAIARMLLIAPQVLILDDATSALDAHTENQFRLMLSKYLHESQKTAIIISQKVSTLRDADKIYILQEGRIADQGTHEDLLRANQTYRRLNQTQETA